MLLLLLLLPNWQGSRLFSSFRTGYSLDCCLSWSGVLTGSVSLGKLDVTGLPFVLLLLLRKRRGSGLFSLTPGEHSLGFCLSWGVVFVDFVNLGELNDNGVAFLLLLLLLNWRGSGLFSVFSLGRKLCFSVDVFDSIPCG